MHSLCVGYLLEFGLFKTNAVGVGMVRLVKNKAWLVPLNKPLFHYAELGR